MVDFMNSIQSQNSVNLALEQAKMQSLNGPLKNHENKEDLRKAAQQFEGVFLNQLLNAMDKTVDREDSLFEDDQAQDMFRGMLYDKVSEDISTRKGGSGLGLADAIYRQMVAKLPADEKDEPIQLRPLGYKEYMQ